MAGHIEDAIRDKVLKFFVPDLLIVGRENG